MSVLPIFGLVLVTLLAVAFVAVPLWRSAQSRKRRALLFAGLVLFLLGVGGGTYWIVGRPDLAQRQANGLKTRELNALVPYLIEHLRKEPRDSRAWRYLGQVYLQANDPGDAAKALGRAIEIDGKGDASLTAAYGEALVMQSGGTVSATAEAAFVSSLTVDPRNAPARYYLGIAKLQKNDRQGALLLWQSLLADTPPTSQLYQMLVDRVAALTAQAPNGAPDPKAMVAMLAARLKADPNDALGWVRLMRAYTVLGETQKAKDALAMAKKSFAGNADAQTAFDTAAKALKLQ